MKAVIFALLLAGCSATTQQPQQPQQQETNYLGNFLTILQIISMFGPQSPLAGGPHQAAQQAQPQQQPTRCQDLGNGVVNCW
jgi:hypothetical protein